MKFFCYFKIGNKKSAYKTRLNEGEGEGTFPGPRLFWDPDFSLSELFFSSTNAIVISEEGPRKIVQFFFLFHIPHGSGFPLDDALQDFQIYVHIQNSDIGPKFEK